MRNELLKHVILTHDDKDLSELVRDESKVSEIAYRVRDGNSKVSCQYLVSN